VHNLHALVFTWSVMEKSHDHVMAGVLIAGMHAHGVLKSINVKADAVPLIECKMVLHCIAQNNLGMT